MNVKTRPVVWWITAGLSLVASIWSFNLATYNWFAADHHNEYSHAFALRGNAFSILSIALFVVFISLLIIALRSRKKKSCD